MAFEVVSLMIYWNNLRRQFYQLQLGKPISYISRPSVNIGPKMIGTDPTRRALSRNRPSILRFTFSTNYYEATREAYSLTYPSSAVNRIMNLGPKMTGTERFRSVPSILCLTPPSSLLPTKLGKFTS